MTPRYDVGDAISLDLADTLPVGSVIRFAGDDFERVALGPGVTAGPCWRLVGGRGTGWLAGVASCTVRRIGRAAVSDPAVHAELERARVGLAMDNDLRPDAPDAERLRALVDRAFALDREKRARENAERIQEADGWKPVRSLRDIAHGDVLRHRGSDVAYLVTGNYGDRVTAVRTVDVANPCEWLVMREGER